jgi:hypothetical protein
LRANVLHLTFIPNEQTQPELDDMFQYIMEESHPVRKEEKLPRTYKAVHFARQRTLENAGGYSYETVREILK